MIDWHTVVEALEKEEGLPERNLLKRILDTQIGQALGGIVEHSEGEQTLAFRKPDGSLSYQGSLPHYTRNFHEVLPLIAGKEFRVGGSKDGDGEVAVWVPQKDSKIPKIYKQEFIRYEVSLAMGILFLRIEEETKTPVP